MFFYKYISIHCLHSDDGKLTPLYLRHDLTFVQIASLRSRGVLQFLLSSEISFDSARKTVDASTTATGRDL